MAGNPKGAGKKPYAPTDAMRELVGNLSSVGWSHDKIAAGMGITANTLRKYYQLELDCAKASRLSMVYGALYENAVKHNNVSAQIFICKTQGGMKETQVSEHSGPDGQPLNLAPPVINVLFQNPPDQDEGSE